MTCDFPYHVANLVLFLKRWTSFLKKFRLSVSHSVVSDCNLTDCSLSSSSRKFFLWRFSIGNSPTKNPGADCHSLLQGIFPKQGSNPGLPHCRQILYQLSHKGSPRIPFPGDLPNPGIQLGSPALQVDSLPTKLPRNPFSYKETSLRKVDQEEFIFLLELFRTDSSQLSEHSTSS